MLRDSGRETTENIFTLNMQGHSNINSFGNNYSPRSNMNSQVDFKRFSTCDESNNSQKNYSPFVIKRSPNLINSSSSSRSNFQFGNENTQISGKFITSESRNGTFQKCRKIYTPSPHCQLGEKFSDRFIPVNKGENLMEKFEMAEKELKEEGGDDRSQTDSMSGTSESKSKSNYSFLLESNFGYNLSNNQTNNQTPVKSKLFSYKTEQKRRFSGLESNSHFSSNLFNSSNFFTNLTSNSNSNQNGSGINSNSGNRKISSKPYKTIESPDLIDDFYLNLLDWSSKNEIVVGEGNSVYVWCANKTQKVKLLGYDGEKYVSSVMWNPNGTEVAVGNSDGETEIWDVNQKKLTRVLDGHDQRIGVVAWNCQNPNILSTGSKDHSILNRDLRTESDYFSRFLSHKQEVCGLKWSFDGSQLASGGNDNKLMIWSLNSSSPMMRSSHHSAAVKALAWSPHQSNLLVSGGGTADRCIRFWNTSTFNQTNFLDTGSQVCNLVFSKTANELVSTHGYSLNQIFVWKLPSMTKLATLTGHSFRVLYLGLSPDGQNIVTGAGDQTLRFWSVFPPFTKTEGSCLFPSTSDLR